jgi:capsular exopolysaccharide synthesis family protein
MFRSDTANGGRKLGGFSVRQAHRDRAAPGSWPRFLVKHALWIGAITAVSLACAHYMLRGQSREYSSTATVVVQPGITYSGNAQALDMATEKGILTSNAVLSIAGSALHVPTSALSAGLSVASPGSTFLLTISDSNADPKIAQQRAQAIAAAYVKYRAAKAAADTGGKTAVHQQPLPTTAPTAALITPAALPAAPSSPKPTLDYIIALLLGLVLGIVTAAIRDRMDDRLRGAADLAERTGAPVLAMIPAYWTLSRDAAARLVMTRSPGSIVADAYRGLRTRLVQSAVAQGTGVLLVTCPAREDKEAVTANLAAALAQSGRSVIVVCADLRWGRIHRFFGSDGGAEGDGEGLAGLVAQRAELADVLRPTQVAGVDLVPPGPQALDPGAVLQRPSFGALIAQLRDRADYVLIDAPPVLASADVSALTGLAGLTLLTADARRSRRAQVRAAMGELEQAGAGPLCCVLTGVGRRRLLRRNRAASQAPASQAPASQAPASQAPADPLAGPHVRDETHRAATTAARREITTEDES